MGDCSSVVLRLGKDGLSLECLGGADGAKLGLPGTDDFRNVVGEGGRKVLVVRSAVSEPFETIDYCRSDENFHLHWLTHFLVTFLFHYELLS